MPITDWINKKKIKTCVSESKTYLTDPLSSTTQTWVAKNGKKKSLLSSPTSRKMIRVKEKTYLKTAEAWAELNFQTWVCCWCCSSKTWTKVVDQAIQSREKQSTGTQKKLGCFFSWFNWIWGWWYWLGTKGLSCLRKQTSGNFWNENFPQCSFLDAELILIWWATT